MHPARSGPAGRTIDVDTETTPRTEVLRALADPARWALLEHLAREREVPRKALGEALGLSQTALTYHLRVLLSAGLIELRKSGRNLYCMSSPDTLVRLEDAVATLVRPHDR
jgi:ArsR family transcriptional regulator